MSEPEEMTILRAAAIVLVGIALIMSLFPSNQPPIMPQCPEDAVIVGDGDFAAGRWERYECGPALDDFVVD